MTINDLKIIYEDNYFLVIDKPAGLVVHPGAGDIGKTLSELIVEKYPAMKNYTWDDEERPGIVHRLDKDTSGLILVAKNPDTQKYFQEQFKSRTIEKKYVALTLGKIDPPNGEIKIYIQRDPNNKRSMSVSYLGEGRAAITKYNTVKNYLYKKNLLTLVEVKPETGRMHQIRVHLKHEGYPIIGDQKYNTKLSKRLSKELNFSRQFLHAISLKVELPNGNIKEFSSDLSSDLKDILKKLILAI